jgi:hypothetical protein
MAALDEVPRGADADDAGAEDECFHASKFAADGRISKAGLN